MDSNRKFDITTWSGESVCTVNAIRVHTHRHRVSPRFLGLAGTVLIHILVLQSFLLRTSAIKIPKPPIQGGPVSSSIIADAESELTLVVVQPVESPTSKDRMFEEFISRGAQPKDFSIVLLSLVPPAALDLPEGPLSEDQEADSLVPSGDSAARKQLLGIYSGQIQARVERVWRRPRTPVTDNPAQRPSAGGDEAFRCQVRIIQDAIGNVQEILLPQCNGSAAWQRSLIVAIRQASPLPAPPSPSVFTNALTMSFIGFEYRPDSSADDYEMEAPRMQAQNRLDTLIKVRASSSIPVTMASPTDMPLDDQAEHPVPAPTDETPGTLIEP